MSFVVKKRDLTDPAQLQALIIEHATELEEGLTILDSRLMLGQATIDMVGVDADGALVLIAVGLVADEEMFLKAVDAYSWCLEYPEAIRRLYPTVQSSSAHPPRVMFVVERMPDAFHRKIKQLGFAEVDCVEFRHLDVDGTAAVYFDTLARLRRAAPTAPTPDRGAVPTPPVTGGRPTNLKLQKLLGADRPAATREPTSVVRMVHRAAPRPEPKSAPSVPRAERVVAPKSPVETPVVPKAESVDAAIASSAPSQDLVAASAVAEAVACVPELLAHGLDAADALVEPFAVVEQHRQNGHVEPLSIVAEPARLVVEPQLHVVEPARLVVEPQLPVPEPPRLVVEPQPAVAEAPRLVVEPQLPVAEPPRLVVEPQLPVAEPDLPMPEPARQRSKSVVEPAPVSLPPAVELPRPAPADVAPEVVRDVVAAELLIPLAEPAAPEPLALADVQEQMAPEPAFDSLAATFSAAEPTDGAAEPVAPIVLELEHPIVEPEPEANVPLTAVAEPLMIEPRVARPEPATSALSIDPLETLEQAAPVAAPAPSVFSRRPPEAVGAREAKVSFAGVAKDLLPQNHRPPEPEPAVSVARASVEEITRGALDDLVGATEKRAHDERATAFAKPGGPFAKPTQKRPRSIAPPPSDGQPIAAVSKLASAPKRVAADPPPAADGETAQAVPQGFEGLQFPNDGVLTRQWMEFLNQMGAGK